MVDHCLYDYLLFEYVESFDHESNSMSSIKSSDYYLDSLISDSFDDELFNNKSSNKNSGDESPGNESIIEITRKRKMDFVDLEPVDKKLKTKNVKSNVLNSKDKSKLKQYRNIKDNKENEL